MYYIHVDLGVAISYVLQYYLSCVWNWVEQLIVGMFTFYMFQIFEVENQSKTITTKYMHTNSQP